MNSIPAVCSNCGFTFPSPISLGSSRNSSVTNCSTNCPRCGGSARVLDSFTDSEGQLHIRDLFNFVQNFNDPKKLNEIKSNLEAANDAMTAVELADTLAEIEPGFDNFRKIIRSIPAKSIASFIHVLISIITLVIMYQTWQATEENHDEDIDVSRAQLELSREEFEYKKQQDEINKASKDQADKERNEIKKQIEDLKLEFERKLKVVEGNKSKPVQHINNATKSILKGNCRNKPCPCGSGKKAKKCHPNGFPK